MKSQWTKEGGKQSHREIALRANPPKLQALKSRNHTLSFPEYSAARILLVIHNYIYLVFGLNQLNV